MDKTKMLIGLSAMTILLAVVGYAVISALSLECGMLHLLAVPLYFWIFYSLSIIVMKKPDDAKSFAGMLMAFKSAKMFLSLVVVALLAFLFRESAIVLLFYFLVYSLIMLAVESVYLVKLKKNISR